MREPPPSPPYPLPSVPGAPHLSQSWRTCAQVSGVLVPHGRQPAAVSLLQEAFGAECSSCVAAWTTLILQHKRVLWAQAQEAAQQPASQSRSTTELPHGAQPAPGKAQTSQPSPSCPSGTAPQHPLDRPFETPPSRSPQPRGATATPLQPGWTAGPSPLQLPRPSWTLVQGLPSLSPPAG